MGTPFIALVGRGTVALLGTWNPGFPTVIDATETPGVTPGGVTTGAPGV